MFSNRFNTFSTISLGLLVILVFAASITARDLGAVEEFRKEWNELYQILNKEGHKDMLDLLPPKEVLTKSSLDLIGVAMMDHGVPYATYFHLNSINLDDFCDIMLKCVRLFEVTLTNKLNIPLPNLPENLIRRNNGKGFFLYGFQIIQYTKPIPNEEVVRHLQHFALEAQKFKIKIIKEARRNNAADRTNALMEYLNKWEKMGVKVNFEQLKSLFDKNIKSVDI